MGKVSKQQVEPESESTDNNNRCGGNWQNGDTGRSSDCEQEIIHIVYGRRDKELSTDRKMIIVKSAEKC